MTETRPPGRVNKFGVEHETIARVSFCESCTNEFGNRLDNEGHN